MAHDPKEIEKSMLALFLCAPTDLNKEWARSGHGPGFSAAAEEHLMELGLSLEVNDMARSFMTLVDGETRQAFAIVATRLFDEIWKEQPHPAPSVAKDVVKAFTSGVVPQ